VHGDAAAAAEGMAQKSAEFLAAGAEVYLADPALPPRDGDASTASTPSTSSAALP
jgi:hypothetical protein